MAVQLIPNQLVKLYDSETFNDRNKRLTLDYRQYCQIVREEQTTMFQLRILPSTGDNLVTNGDFQNDISSWAHTVTFEWVDGRARGDYVNTSPIMYQDIPVTTGLTHRFVFTVEFTEVTNELLVIINSQQQIFTAADYGIGTHTFTIYWLSDTASAHIEFQLTQAVRDIIYIDNVQLYELTEPVVTLEKCTGELVQTIAVFDRSDDYLTYAVNWFGLEETCYRICIEGIDDTEKNLLDRALALSTEGGAPIELEQGGYLKWFG